VNWVTREHVHVDRTACPWLIRRFVDSKARFIFVPVDRIEGIVKKENATPYDAPGVELGHHGERCSFDAFIEKYGIEDPALLELAGIVRAADTGRKEAAPEASGLDAIMTGISIAARDDHEAIERAGPVYDALYTYCRLKLLRSRYKIEIENMDSRQRREFLRRKLVQEQSE